MAQKFIKIGEERFKETSITRYKFDGKSTVNKKWYITIWFGSKERKFPFDSEQEVIEVIGYLDDSLGVKII